MATYEWGEFDKQDDWELDGTGKSAEDLGGGNNVDKEGWYHFEVADVVADLSRVNAKGNPKSPSIRFDLLVIHPHEGQSPVGARLFHRLYLGSKDGGPPAEGSRDAAFRFGLGLGILKEIGEGDQKSIVDAETGSPKIGLATWQRAKGRQCIAKVVAEKEEKFGERFVIPYGRVFDVADPAVEKVPKNLQAIKLAGKALPKASAGKKQPEPAAAALDNIADL